MSGLFYHCPSSERRSKDGQSAFMFRSSTELANTLASSSRQGLRARPKGSQTLLVPPSAHLCLATSFCPPIGHFGGQTYALPHFVHRLGVFVDKHMSQPYFVHGFVVLVDKLMLQPHFLHQMCILVDRLVVRSFKEM